MGTAKVPVKSLYQDFYIPQDPVNVWGEFTKTGKLYQMWGYKADDLVDTKPEKPKPLPPPPEKPVDHVDPDMWYFQYLRDDQQPVKYMVMKRQQVRDYSQRGRTIEITPKKTISIYGVFRYKGRTLLLPRMENAAIHDYWYGITEVDGYGNRYVEEIPDYTTVLEESQTTIPERKVIGNSTLLDDVVHTFSRIEAKLFKARNKKG
jgi:hypothetical protein